MYLVGVHAQVSAAAAPSLERTLNALVEDIAEESLRCFRQVSKFGMGGMLRVSTICTQLLRRTDWRMSTGDTGDRVHAPDTLAIRHAVRCEDALGLV